MFGLLPTGVCGLGGAVLCFFGGESGNDFPYNAAASAGSAVGSDAALLTFLCAIATPACSVRAGGETT